jgi:outer membrane protein TolC
MSWPAFTQESIVLTLEFCQQQAVMNYPSYRQYELLKQTEELEQKNLGKNWLPSLNLNGQASYQSDVTKVPTIIPEFAPEPISKDWYKIYLDVNQVIWDGGATKQGKAIENLDHNIDILHLDIELYSLKQQVNDLFFSLLLLQENRNLLNNHASMISSRLEEVESAVRNGVVLSSNADILKAELLKVEQKIEEINIAEEAAFQSLSLLIGQDIPEGAILKMPAPVISMNLGPQERLEFGLFDLQQQKLEAMKKMSGTTLLPKFQAFGQAGMGRPAFDMLNDNFDDYYIVGVRMNWNFWNWNKTHNEKSILDINHEIISSKRDAFDRNLSIKLENNLAEIKKYENMLQKDQEILDLRSKVVKQYASRLNNGVITATEYLTELNAESEARLNINIHKINLVQAKYQYMATIGRL